MKRQTYFTIQLMILLLVFLVLLYFYLILSRPLQPTVKVPTTKGVEYEYLFEIVGYGSRPDELMERPNGVATDDRANIYIADTYRNRVLVFNRNGKFLFKIGRGVPASEGKTPGPNFVTVDPKGNIYVTRADDKIQVFDASGTPKHTIELFRPLALAATSNKLYVTTLGSVVVFDLRGNRLTSWGVRGRRRGQFRLPNGIAVGKEGRVYVSDSQNKRVQILNKTGKVIRIIEGPAGNRPFNLPAGLAVDEKERIYVVDGFTGMISIFNNKGKLLAEVAQEGEGPGQFYFPVGIAYAGGNIFYVADKFNNRVQVVSIKLPEPATLASRIGGFPILLPSLALLILLLLLIVAYWRRRKRLTAAP